MSRAGHGASEAGDVYVVVLDALVRGEDVMHNGCAYTSQFVRGDAYADSTTAQGNAARYVSPCHGLGQWDHEVRVVVQWVEPMRAEVLDIAALAPH